MDNNITKKILRNFTYEIVERIVRFIVHLEEIEAQFYKDRNRFKIKVELIDHYKKALEKLLSIALIGYKKEIIPNNTDNYSNLFDILKDILKSVNELHTEYLSVLPRPSEPVELTRFERVIHKQIIQLTDEEEMKQNISISINEKIGEEICSDPLSYYKLTSINELFSQHDLKNKYGIENLNIQPDDKKVHITIPRIDASNTFRWASLIHEMAHSLFKYVKFKNNNIEKEFLTFFSVKKKETLFNGFFRSDKKKPFPATDTLKKWLEECWCDLFASILIGPSFYFSQYLAFMNEGEKVDDGNYVEHPPSTFRLDLIESILSNRFPIENYKKLDFYINNCEKLLSLVLKNNTMSFEKRSEMRQILSAFCLFFKSHFLAKDKDDKKSGEISLKNNEKINERLISLVNKYVRIHPEVIEYLVSRLNENLPIPSIKIFIDGNYQEIPTYVQEIFLASWLSRCETTQFNILKIITKTKENDMYENIKDPYLEIRKIIVRHDQAVLKSIQVSEWFDFLIPEKIRPEKITVYTKEKKEEIDVKGVLVDHQIESLILNDELKIIPLMYFNRINEDGKPLNQIGTTSIDIRLGTSFQVFYPEQYGIIDFTQENENQSFKTSSERINLDFLESITITPGQFLLGHSMEYVKLPNDICGNLEGRSSFARLGIEIHMTAGYIDPGFEGVITFEIYNAGPTTVKLYPGMRIGQIRFERNSIPKEKYSQKHTVKYKGLLEHDVSRQSKDFEVELIKEYKKKEREKEVERLKIKK